MDIGESSGREAGEEKLLSAEVNDGQGKDCKED